MSKRTSTTKDVGLLHQLYQEGQLELVTEFQRNSVWPPAAKAYLIDTILNDRPIPILFFQRTTSAQTGRPSYAVIDGQQRLRAIFEFLDNRFRLSQSDKAKAFYNKKFADLSPADQEQIRAYDLVVAELSGYSTGDIEDMFLRMNKYVVKLSPQEIRHAKAKGKFHDFVEHLGKLAFWPEQKVFTQNQIDRFRAVEFSAELVILLVEGPQDKKKAIDLYYGNFRDAIPFRTTVETRITQYLRWILSAIPDLSASRFRKPVDLYSLIGAIDNVSDSGKNLGHISALRAGALLKAFEQQTSRKQLAGAASRYVVAASQQTDNLRPRTTRIDILSEILTDASR